MAKGPERLFAEKVDADLFKLKNAWFENIQQVATRGTPDRIGVINGWFIGLELKVDGNKPTPLQNRKLNRIALAKGFAFTVTPQNWAYVYDKLLELDASII